MFRRLSRKDYMYQEIHLQTTDVATLEETSFRKYGVN